MTGTEEIPLDGEWQDGVSTVSGGGTPGGDFQFRFNVLPGDATNSGNVVAADVSMLASHFGQFLPPDDPLVPQGEGTAATTASGMTSVGEMPARAVAIGPVAPRLETGTRLATCFRCLNGCHFRKSLERETCASLCRHHVMGHVFPKGRLRPFKNRVDAVVLPLSFLTMDTSSSVVTRALMDGTSRGEVSVRSGVRAKTLPSFRRIRTFPDTSALSNTLERFCRASEYV